MTKRKRGPDFSGPLFLFRCYPKLRATDLAGQQDRHVGSGHGVFQTSRIAVDGDAVARIRRDTGSLENGLNGAA